MCIFLVAPITSATRPTSSGSKMLMSILLFQVMQDGFGHHCTRLKCRMTMYIIYTLCGGWGWMCSEESWGLGQTSDSECGTGKFPLMEVVLGFQSFFFYCLPSDFCHHWRQELSANNCRFYEYWFRYCRRAKKQPHTQVHYLSLFHLIPIYPLCLLMGISVLILSGGSYSWLMKFSLAVRVSRLE